MNGPTKIRLEEKKNKTAKDCRCICFLTYKFNTIKNLGFFYIVLRRRFFCNNITYNITAFFDSYKEKKREKLMVYQNVLT